jgi:hypothetical protein
MKNIVTTTLVAVVFYSFTFINTQAVDMACTGLFSDVTTNEKFCPYIEYLYHQKIISGDKNDNYKYKAAETLSRGQLAKIIRLAFQIPTNTSGEDFKDVEKTNTFYTDIKSLKNASIITGNGEGFYKPADTVTRGALMKFITNAARYKSNNKVPTSNYNLEKTFPDINPDHTFYNFIRDIYSLSLDIGDKDLKIISGYTDGKFYPDISVTRGQSAKIIANSMILLNLETVDCSKTFCQDKFTGPIVSSKNVYNDGNIKITFPDPWTKSSNLTNFLFAYEFNSGVQSIVGEKTSLNYVLELDERRCTTLGKEIQTQLSGENSTFDEVNLIKTELLTISENKVCKIELQNTRDNIQVLQDIYILVLDMNQVYQVVSTSGSGSAVDESIIKGMEIL